MVLIRPATIHDVPLLRALIRELAEFERKLSHCLIEESDLAKDGFGPHPKFRAVIAEWDGQTAGYALHFDYYSTWIGPCLYLEDLFVRKQYRGKGIGMALLSAAAQAALQNGGRAMRWEVLDWNTKAIELYQSLGAEFRDELRSVLLTEPGIRKLAGSNS